MQILRALNHHFGDSNSDVLKEMRARLATDRVMIAGSDIDGIVSSMMLASVSGWRIGALVVRSERILAAPGYEDIKALIDRKDVFGVDVFSPMFPSISNHPLLFGVLPGMKASPLRHGLEEFDEFVLDRCLKLRSINLSAWVGIRARFNGKVPEGLPYKYPLGTAQLLLAVLELAGRAPRFYDRQYLPWLVANCDGGLDTIRQYPWNVEGWWSALAAVVGPASHSEALYRLATGQRPTEFVDIDRRLRYDDARSGSLNVKWNLASQKPATIAQAVSLISDLSGWPDPFIGGASGLEGWKESSPSRGVLSMKGLTTQDLKQVDAHLSAARSAIHASFSTFKERGVSLGWMLPDRRPELDKLVGKDAPAELSPEDAALRELAEEAPAG